MQNNTAFTGLRVLPLKEQMCNVSKLGWHYNIFTIMHALCLK